MADREELKQQRREFTEDRQDLIAAQVAERSDDDWAPLAGVTRLSSTWR